MVRKVRDTIAVFADPQFNRKSWLQRVRGPARPYLMLTMSPQLQQVLSVFEIQQYHGLSVNPFLLKEWYMAFLGMRNVDAQQSLHMVAPSTVGDINTIQVMWMAEEQLLDQ